MFIVQLADDQRNLIVNLLCKEMRDVIAVKTREEDTSEQDEELKILRQALIAIYADAKFVSQQPTQPTLRLLDV